MRPQHFVCDQPDCPWQGEVRALWPTPVGRGMFVKPPVFCECSLDIEMRRVDPPRLMEPPPDRSWVVLESVAAQPASGDRECPEGCLEIGPPHLHFHSKVAG